MLNAFAVLFALLGVSNLLKPLRFGGEQTGFVLFGHRLDGTANAIAGPLFGLFLFVYAYTIWKRRQIALPLGVAYAIYVLTNLLLYSAFNERPPGASYLAFMVAYTLVALGVSGGAVALLVRERSRLG
jgi:hypothetical protein